MEILPRNNYTWDWAAFWTRQILDYVRDRRSKDNSRKSQQFFLYFKVLLQHVSAHV